MWNMKWIVPVATLGLLIGAAVVVPARADDAPTTMPTTAPAATITVTVTDASNNPVSGATVSLFPARAKKPAPADGTTPAPDAGGGRQRPTPLATAETNDQGVAVLNVSDLGKYQVTARMKGVGRGNAHVTIDTDGQAATVAITLKPRTPKNGADAPAGSPAPTNPPAN